MKKLSAIILAVLMALTLAVSAMAYEANEVVLVMMNSAGDPVVSDPVAIAADGEYTFKIEGLDFSKDQIQTIYIKEAVAHEGQANSTEYDTNFPEGIEILTKSIKVNGEERAITEGYPTTKNEAEPSIIDICWYNIWATSYVDLEGLFDVNSVEVTVEVKFPGAEEAPAEEEAPADEPADEPEVETEVEVEDTPAETGLALSLIPAVIALAVVALKRR